ncbi:MAG: hypothetical protein DI585_04415 [Pseudomonas fluorescens]|nr:MAG: hypothetical protein DI585_04415 [Pseudomonas fluorescens]
MRLSAIEDLAAHPTLPPRERPEYLQAQADMMPKWDDNPHEDPSFPQPRKLPQPPTTPIPPALQPEVFHLLSGDAYRTLLVIFMFKSWLIMPKFNGHVSHFKVLPLKLCAAITYASKKAARKLLF